MLVQTDAARSHACIFVSENSSLSDGYKLIRHSCVICKSARHNAIEMARRLAPLQSATFSEWKTAIYQVTHYILILKRVCAGRKHGIWYYAHKASTSPELIPLPNRHRLWWAGVWSTEVWPIGWCPHSDIYIQLTHCCDDIDIGSQITTTQEQLILQYTHVVPDR